MALTDVLMQELLGNNSVDSLSKSTGVDGNQVTKLVSAALPILLSGMAQNSETKEGAESLATALQDHATNKKEDTAQMLQEADVKDGEKAVTHILGDQTKDIAKGLSKQTGISSKQVMTILATLTPVLLSLLGSHNDTGDNNAVNANGLGGVLTSLLFGSGSNVSSASSSGLDLASIAGALLGGGSSSNNSNGNVAGQLIGSLLGGGAMSSNSNNSNVAGQLLGSLLGGGASSNNDGNNSTASLAGSLIGSLLGGSGNSNGKNDSTADAIGSLLGGLLK